MNESLIITNMISSMLNKYLGIEPMSAMLLVSLSSKYFTKDNIFLIFEIIKLYQIYFLIILGLSFVLFFMKHSYKKVNNVNFVTLTIFKYSHIQEIIIYINNYSDYFDIPNYEYGNKKFQNTCDTYFPTNQKLYFHDKLFNVKGYLEFGDAQMSEDKKNQYSYRYIKINIDKNQQLTPLNYYKKIVKKNTDDNNKKSDLTCKFVKYMCTNDNKISTRTCLTIYEGQKDETEKRYNSFIKSYFSPKRDEIWKLVKRVHFEPEKFYSRGQIPTTNLLFYGPPGTGKSTLAYRLAITTGRHLISLNIIDYIHRKDLLYELLTKPIINNYYYTPKNCIFLIEEFDNTIRYLKDQDKRYNYSKYYQNKRYGPHHWSKNSLSLSSDCEDEIVDNKDNKDNKDDKDDKNDIKAGDSRTLKLGDLLEILQSAVPIDGSIIIATTNHFDYIKKTLPALVRPGRLTPIKITYIDWKCLEELTEFYFKEKLTIDEFIIEYPTSGIVEKALLLSDEENGFEKFQDFILTLSSKDK